MAFPIFSTCSSVELPPFQPLTHVFGSNPKSRADVSERGDPVRPPNGVRELTAEPARSGHCQSWVRSDIRFLRHGTPVSVLPKQTQGSPDGQLINI